MLRIIQIHIVGYRIIRHHQKFVIRHPRCHPAAMSQCFKDPDFLTIPNHQQEAFFVAHAITLYNLSHAPHTIPGTVRLCQKDHRRKALSDALLRIGIVFDLSLPAKIRRIGSTHGYALFIDTGSMIYPGIGWHQAGRKRRKRSSKKLIAVMRKQIAVVYILSIGLPFIRIGQTLPPSKASLRKNLQVRCRQR